MANLDEKKSYYCEKCNRTMAATEFYKSNNLTKYPNEGKFPQCKKCLTMHVDNWNPDTYLWILQEADVPYVPAEWNKLMASYARDPAKVTGTTIVGRYLGKMQLTQYRKYRWKDSEFLQELAANEMEQAMKRQGYNAQEIAVAVNRASVEIPQGILVPPPPPEPEIPEEIEDYFDSLDDTPAPGLDLTPEEKVYLRLKWGKSYRPEEWVRLEQLYEEMMASYDIQAAGHIDTLKLICKTSLKANQMLDLGDLEGAQKMIKMYDGLMKSGKFTAAQNKAEQGEYVDSISELVAICETDGFIPRYYVDEPKDKVDRVIQDLQDYTRTLITEEMNLGALIEKAVRQIEDDKARDERLDDNDDVDDDDLFEKELFETPAPELSDEDFVDFEDFKDEMSEMDYSLFDEEE